MYAAIAHYFLNVTGIPFGFGAVSSPLGGWIVVAAFLVSTILLLTCVDRNARTTFAERGARWAVSSRIEEFWGFRVRCAEAVLRNS